MKFSLDRALLLVMLFQRMGGAASLPPSAGSLCAAVVDGSGSYVTAPHLYIYGEESRRSYQVEGAQGLASISLPPGHYRVYSAYNRRHGDFVERFISYEAHVRVASGEASSVMLKAVETTPARVYLSEDARRKIGLAPELAQYLN